MAATETGTTAAAPEKIVATETVIVRDEALGIDRKVVLGQQVPPDLVEAYREKVGDAKASADPAQAVSDANYGSQSVEDLRVLAGQRGLDVGDKAGKKDLVAAHEEYDGRGGA